MFTGFESIREIDEVWRYFKYCLQTQNRFFFEHPLLPLIKGLFHNSTFTLPQARKIYRARIDYDQKYENQCWLARKYAISAKSVLTSRFSDYYQDTIAEIKNDDEYQKFLMRNARGFEGFDEQDSGAPPFEKATAGRCNPEHVAFLYAASDEHTATAEVRPYIRDAVSIATLTMNRDLTLVDFYYEWDADGGRVIDNFFFDKMRMEFSLLNKGDKEAYLTTQYLTLLAQHLGFDGLRFRSSLVENGENYVIFDPDNCKAVSSKMYVINKVEYNLLPILTEEEKEVIE